MDDGRIDLSALDPDRDPDRRDRVVGAAMARVRAARRPAAASPPDGAWLRWIGWWRPAVAFATVVLAVSAGVLRSVPEPGGPPPTVAAAGVPPAVAEWLASDALPPAAEVVAAVRGYR